MSYTSQKTLRSFVMAYLFAAAQTDRAGRGVEEMRRILKAPIGERRIQIAINELESDELVEDIGRSSFYEYALTSEGYDSAEKSYLEEDNAKFRDLIDQLVQKLMDEQGSHELVSIPTDEQKVPAADRFVEIGHNTAGYREVVEAVEIAAESIRQSNSLTPEDRGWIQANLEIGLGALKKGGKLLVDGLKTFALDPLKAALTSISEEKLKAAIAFAITALRNFLGL